MLLQDSVDMSLSKLREIVKDGEAWHAAIHEASKSQTRLSNGTTVVKNPPASVGDARDSGSILG